MKLVIRFGQIILAIAWLMVAFTAWTNVHAGSKSTIGLYVNGVPVQYDLSTPEGREAIQKDLAGDYNASVCFRKAGYAVSFMKRRDQGVTLEEELQNVRDQYEQTKLEPEGAIPWSVYIDFERMVRDIHRHVGSGAKREYWYTESGDVWAREFRWCVLPSF